MDGTKRPENNKEETPKLENLLNCHNRNKYVPLELSGLDAISKTTSEKVFHLDKRLHNEEMTGYVRCLFTQRQEQLRIREMKLVNKFILVTNI